MKKRTTPVRINPERRFRVSKGKFKPRDQTVRGNVAKPADEEKKEWIECASPPCYLAEIED